MADRYETRVVDYDRDIDYTQYWSRRTYEQQAEVLALGRLLTATGDGWLADLGGGFGRLVPVYEKLGQPAVLVDHSMSLLKDARHRWGLSTPLIAANLYHLPFRSGTLDTAVMVRVLHHLAAYEQAFEEISRVVTTRWILDIPNKRHMLARVRAAFSGRLQEVHAAAPVNLARDSGSTYLNFHPPTVLRRLASYGWRSTEILSVSNFRGINTRIPKDILMKCEAHAQRRWSRALFGPSQFVRLERKSPPSPCATIQPIHALLCCPICRGDLEGAGEAAAFCRCRSCRQSFPKLDANFWDFRWPIGCD